MYSFDILYDPSNLIYQICNNESTPMGQVSIWVWSQFGFGLIHVHIAHWVCSYNLYKSFVVKKVSSKHYLLFTIEYLFNGYDVFVSHNS